MVLALFVPHELSLTLIDINLFTGLSIFAVENTSDLEVGEVVFLWIIFVITPPKVSSPRDNGVTSKSTMSLTSLAKTPTGKKKILTKININASTIYAISISITSDNIRNRDA